MTERQVKVRLSAQVQEYIAGMEKAAKATRETGSEAEKLAQKRESFTLMGQAAMASGAAMLAAAGLTARSAMQWDSAWAGVLKTVDGTPEQLDRVEEGLRDLTSILPASHTEIAAVAEAAGQLGIQTDNVVAFTRTMIDLGETTNMSSEEAATSLARFMNVMGTSQDQVSNLGSSVVALGNNYATTEGEIVAFSQRLAGAGTVVGLTEGDVLGLATALSSVGVNAEAGGTAFSKVMINIASAVESGSDELKDFAEVAGMSADQFAAHWREAPAEALATFITGLSNAEAQGKSTFAVLEQLGVTEQRMRDSLLLASSAADMFTDAMQMGNDAFRENNALTEEAEKRYETTEAKLGIMVNQVTDAAIALGENLLPALEYGAETVGNFAEAVGTLEGPLAGFVSWGGLILGTGLLAAGTWMVAIPKIAEYRKALIDLELAGGRLHRTLSRVGRLAAAGLAIGVIVAMIRQVEAETERLNAAIDGAATSTRVFREAAEAQMSKGKGHWYEILPGELSKIKHGADDVAAALQFAQQQADRKWWDPQNLPGHAEFRDTLSALELIGDEMANLYSGDIPRLNEQLRGMMLEFKWTGEEQWAFIQNSPDLKQALEDAAEDLGLSASKANLLKLAFGELTSLGPKATEALNQTEAGAQDLAEAAEQAERDLRDMQRALADIASEAINMGDAQDRAQSAINRLAEAAKGEEASLYGSNDASIALRNAMRDVEESHRDAAEAMIQNGESAEDAMAQWQKGRDELIDMRVAMGESREEAVKWADENLGSAAEVQGALEQVAAAVSNIPEAKPIDIVVNNTVALQKIREVNDMLASTPGYGGISVDATGGVRGLADGGIIAYANGGMHEFASGGGVDTGIYSGGTPIIKFAEPETGWEAFISGKPSERDRNRQIWQETGRRLGMDAAGGDVHHHYNMTVVAAPGDSLDATANRVVSKIAFKAGGGR